MTKIKFTLDDRKAKRMIENVKKALSDFTPALKDIERFQMQEIKEAYAVSGKNITGKPWPKLSPNYLKSKIRSGFLTPILVRTGKMQKNHSRQTLSRVKLIIENSTAYFKFHQVGGKLPRRQVHGHSNAMIEKTLKILQNFIISKAKV